MQQSHLTETVKNDTTESLRSTTKAFSHTIKQLLHQYHNILALCNIIGELVSFNTACSKYFVVLMQ